MGEVFRVIDKGLDYKLIRSELAGALCLSIRQPWAELILLGKKKVELRTWQTDHRGWIWLHTGVKSDPSECSRFGLSDLFTGGFVGAFRIRDVVPLDPELWDAWRDVHLGPQEYQPEVFGWVIANPLRLVEPMKAPGNVGLFRPVDHKLPPLPGGAFVGESHV